MYMYLQYVSPILGDFFICESLTSTSILLRPICQWHGLKIENESGILCTPRIHFVRRI